MMIVSTKNNLTYSSLIDSVRGKFRELGYGRTKKRNYLEKHFKTRNLLNLSDNQLEELLIRLTSLKEKGKEVHWGKARRDS